MCQTSIANRHVIHICVCTVVGICDGIAAGAITIDVMTGECMASGYGKATHFITGEFGTSSRVFVEEVRLDKDADASKMIH